MSNAHKVGTDRRGFIKEVGVALLTAQLLPSIAQAAEESAGDSKDSAENLIIHSGPGFVPHTHDLLIPYAAIKAPPRQGLNLMSTKALGHTHEVVLSQEQLNAVNKGGTVAVMGGSHTFVIALTHPISDRTKPPATQRRGA